MLYPLSLQLRRAVLDGPVILLPSHRSYLDFILVTYVLFEHGITLPAIAAGQGEGVRGGGLGV